MKRLMLIVGLFIVVIGLCAESAVLEPTGDMYTDVEHNTANVSTELWTADFGPAGQFQRIMINFDLAAYLVEATDGIADKDITKATLKLTRFFSCPSSGTTLVKIFPISEAWDEATWDQHTHVAYDENTSITKSFSGQGGGHIQTFEVEITELCNLLKNNITEFNGFLIKAEPNQKWSKFFSKEHTNADYRPSLTIEWTENTANEGNDVNAPEFSANVFPNPFNPETTISFSNDKKESANVNIYDLRGRLVKAFNNKNSDKVVWNGTDNANARVASGVYFARINVGQNSITRKITLMK